MKSLRVLLLLLFPACLALAGAEPSPVGYWQFPGKAVMQLSADGGASRIRSHGRWTWDDKAKRQFTVLWGNKTSLHFTLAADDSQITFLNKKSRKIVVVRLSEDEAKRQMSAKPADSKGNVFGTEKDE